VVGVTTYRDHAAWGSWHRPAAVLAAEYVDMVAAGGSVPVLLPPVVPWRDSGSAADVAADVVGRLDGLVVVGGADVDPERYGAERHDRTQVVDRGRDDHELALLEAALRRDLPVLGICRGLQLMAILRGGTLVQHLPDVVGHHGHQPERGCFADVAVETVEGTRLASILGSRVIVRCSHHQSIDATGAGLVVSALAADGTVEGIELPGARFVVGVQWHPEEGLDLRLFEALAAAARPLANVT
jgi:putative glutamine amidotransferase